MTKPSKDEAQASPTKQFFVSMLTRDINLADAILDLVDNCLDGALRLADGKSVEYGRHFVKIELASDHFSIEDNCPAQGELNFGSRIRFNVKTTSLASNSRP